MQTELNVTGKPSQFGRGVLVDVSENIIQQFATSLARQIETGDVGVKPLASGLENEDRAADATESLLNSPKPSAVPVESRTRPSADAIDLLSTADSPLAIHGGPLLASLALGCLVGWLIGRRRCVKLAPTRNSASEAPSERRTRRGAVGWVHSEPRSLLALARTNLERHLIRTRLDSFYQHTAVTDALEARCLNGHPRGMVSGD